MHMERRWPRIARALGFLDRNFAFRSRRNVVAAAIGVSALCGLISVLRGQDANWDLRNYHLYNAYALLHDRLGIDLAPAQMQSYFNPVMDLLYYGMSLHLPPLLAGFAMGAWHGLVFLPLAGIAWEVTAGRAARMWLAPVLGLCGLAGGAFLSELGNTMGDNTSAPAVLAALWLLLTVQRLQGDSGRQVAWRWLLAGALLGLAVALKLTNAMYAVALGVAALAGGGTWRQRLVGAALLTLAAALVFVLVAGPWLWKVWQAFGNPLFPQFNAWFQAPLAQPISVGDTRWLPKGWGEILIWPLLFTFNPWRVSEIALFQAVWAVLYVLALAWGAKVLLRRRGDSHGGLPMEGRAAARAVLVFFGVAFAVWLAMFSIHRYLVVLELLAPLMLWLLLHRVLSNVAADRTAAVAIAACAVIAVGGWNDWGHEGWARRGFRVQAPSVEKPVQGVALLVGGEPQAWRVPFLPGAMAYASVASNFPESPAYVEQLNRLIATRGGATYALFPAGVDKKANRLARLNAWAGRLRLSQGPDCPLLRRLAGRKLKAVVEVDGGRCVLVARPGDTFDLSQYNRDLATQADEKLRRYGLALEAESCTVHSSFIGDADYPYQWCRVKFGR